MNFHREIIKGVIRKSKAQGFNAISRSGPSQKTKMMAGEAFIKKKLNSRIFSSLSAIPSVNSKYLAAALIIFTLHLEVAFIRCTGIVFLLRRI